MSVVLVVIVVVAIVRVAVAVFGEQRPLNARLIADLYRRPVVKPWP